MPVEPISAVAAQSMQNIQPTGLGTEARIEGIGSLGAEAQITAPVKPAADGFGDVMTQQLSQLNQVQQTADAQQQALVTGQSTDVTQVVVAAERAQLSMQLATSMRNRVVDAYNELMRTQI